MTRTIATYHHAISATIYTQITDVELECDGFLNYDRTHKFDAPTIKAVHDANIAMIGDRTG